MQAIARQLQIPQGTVSRDLAAMREFWREFPVYDFDKIRLEQLQKIELVEAEQDVHAPGRGRSFGECQGDRRRRSASDPPYPPLRRGGMVQPPTPHTKGGNKCPAM